MKLCSCGHGEATHFGDGGECVVCRRCPSFRRSWLARLAWRWL